MADNKFDNVTDAFGILRTYLNDNDAGDEVFAAFDCIRDGYTKMVGFLMGFPEMLGESKPGSGLEWGRF